jgi:hypothetical protein
LLVAYIPSQLVFMTLDRYGGDPPGIGGFMTSARISRNVPALTCLTVIPGLTAGGTAVAEGPSPTVTDTAVGETAPPLEPEETDLIEGAPTIEGKFSGELSMGRSRGTPSRSALRRSTAPTPATAATGSSPTASA